MKTCKHCGGELVQPDVERNGQKHFNPYTCISALKARAERAEAERAELRAERDAARAGWLDPDTQYPADRQPIIVLLEHEATYYTGEDDPTGDALPEFELWGYQRIIGWRPLPTAPGGGDEEE